MDWSKSLGPIEFRCSEDIPVQTRGRIRFFRPYTYPERDFILDSGLYLTQAREEGFKAVASFRQAFLDKFVEFFPTSTVSKKLRLSNPSSRDSSEGLLVSELAWAELDFEGVTPDLDWRAAFRLTAEEWELEAAPFRLKAHPKAKNYRISALPPGAGRSKNTAIDVDALDERDFKVHSQKPQIGRSGGKRFIPVPPYFTMNRKRKFDIDRHSASARPTPLPPRPSFYTETTRTFQQRDVDAPMLETMSRHFVPVSPEKRYLQPDSPSDDESSDDSTHRLTPVPNRCEQRIDYESSNPPTLGDGADERSEESEDDEGGTSDEDSDGEKAPRAQRESDRPFLQWIPHAALFVDELLRLEGPGTASITDDIFCHSCLSIPPQQEARRSPLNCGEAHRCRDCYPSRLLCSACMREAHAGHPFHRIETWTGSFFARSTLRDIGLRIQLNHPPGEVCCGRIGAADDNFVVIDGDAIHTVALDYCGCDRVAGHVEQLLRFRLFPATTSNPRTAATFRVLESFQMLSFMSRTSAYEFLRAIERKTDNTGTVPVPSRNKAWLRMIREWRHVRLLKRKGAGHRLNGVEKGEPGDCAVLCPACPYPGINVPENLQDVPEHEKWLYATFIAIDANFRLRRKDVSSDAVDPTLNNGRAYVVEEAGFQEHLRRFGDAEDEKSTCNNHDAIKSASVRGGKGSAASGMGSAQCGRHDMKRPCGVGDLQKGERYVNMDYFFLSTLILFMVIRLIVSYDIACQWSKNLPSRCKAYAEMKPNAINDNPDLHINFAVPKFHLPAHVPACQLKYSLNRLPGVGRTDGECPERLWSTFNGLAFSTREMGPGSRRDTLDDNFGDHNWDRTTELDETFFKKGKEAMAMREDQIEEFASVSSGIPDEQVKGFTRSVKAWEADPSQPNPYQGSKDAVSASSVRLKLAAQDEEASKKGNKVFLHKEITPSLLIYQGIELEEQQRRLSFDNEALGSHATDLQKAKVLEKSASIQRKITAFTTIQHLYHPALAVHRKAEEEADGPNDVPPVWNLPLYLPSTPLPSHVAEAPLELVKLEYVYRQAQGYTALRDLRVLILLQVMMQRSKRKHTSGNAMLTRSRKALENVKTRIRRAAEKYRYVRTSLSTLGNRLASATWSSIFLELEEHDLRALTEDEDAGEGRKKLSWIWKVKGASLEDSEEVQCELRIEWCKARARAHRWQEECLLLAEEMRRVKAFFQWEMAAWESRRLYATEKHASYVVDPTDTNIPVTVQNMYHFQARIVDVGRIAYARRQADIRSRMLKAFRARWGTMEEDLRTIPMSSAKLKNLPKPLRFSGTQLVEMVYD